MPKTLRVLSIDFDFFQKVDQFTLTHCYPDGHDLSTELSEIIWAGYYANPKAKEKLDSVICDTKRLDELMRILKTKPNIPTFICNSHKFAYHFITDHFIPDEHDSINIINIDMHHDCFNDNEELDCGNWINHIKKLCPKTTLTWITQPVAIDMYAIDDMKSIIQTDFSKLKTFAFDILFICRSDIWLPPHLDTHFDQLLTLMTRITNNIVVENCVLCPRNIQSLIKRITDAYKEETTCS